MKIQQRIKNLWILGGMLLTVVAGGAENITTDSRVLVGKLPCGLTYYIRHNETPKDRVDFYLAQKVGSILEEENQRGLAHFLEHMAFGGSEHFGRGEMQNYLETIGVKFGEDLNAYTSVDETVYRITNVNVGREGILDTCILILKDWSNGLKLNGDDIEKERGIIKEEWRTRNSAQLRIYEKNLPRLYQGERYAERLPIGKMEVVENFPYEVLREYYRKWYRPDLQGIIIVGDVNEDDVKKKIEAVFANVKHPENAAKRVYYEVQDNEAPMCAIATDAEATRNLLLVNFKYDGTPKNAKHTKDYFKEKILNELVTTILEERIGGKIYKNTLAITDLNARFGNYELSKTKQTLELTAIVRQDSMDNAVRMVLREVRRAQLYGFTQEEIDRAKASIKVSLQTLFNERAHTENYDYAREYIRLFLDNEPAPGIEVEYAMDMEILDEINQEDVQHHLLQRVKMPQNLVISIEGNDAEKIPTEADIQKTIQNVLTENIAPTQENQVKSFDVSPKSRRQDTRETDAKFGYTKIRLRNGIELFVKETNFKDDEICIKGISLGGSSKLPTRGWRTIGIMNDAIGCEGFGQWDAMELNKALTGKDLYIIPYMGFYEEQIKGYSSVKDWEDELKLIYLYMTAPRKDKSAFRAYMDRKKEQLVHADKNVKTTMNDSISRAIYGDNVRMKRIKVDDLQKVRYGQYRKYYKQRCMNRDGWTFYIVGSLGVDDITKTAEKYLGALKRRHRKSEGWRNVGITPIGGHRQLKFDREMETERGIAYIGLFGKENYDIETILHTEMLEQVLKIVYTRSIREEESGAYGVSVASSCDKWIDDGNVRLSIRFETNKEAQERLMQKIYEEMDKIISEGPRADDLQKVKEYMIREIAERRKENSYWIDVMGMWNLWGIDLDSEYEKRITETTAEDIQHLLKRLREQDWVEVVMLPKK